MSKGFVLSGRDDRVSSINERRPVALYAAIDIHKQAFRATVLDPESGEVVEEREGRGIAQLDRSGAAVEGLPDSRRSAKPNRVLGRDHEWLLISATAEGEPGGGSG